MLPLAQEDRAYAAQQFRPSRRNIGATYAAAPHSCDDGGACDDDVGPQLARRDLRLVCRRVPRPSLTGQAHVVVALDV